MQLHMPVPKHCSQVLQLLLMHAIEVCGSSAAKDWDTCTCTSLAFKLANECRPEEQGGEHDGAGAAGGVRGEPR